MLYCIISSILKFFVQQTENFTNISDSQLSNNLVDSSNEFGYDLFRNLSINNENAVISPISVTLGLFMLFLGSKGLTASQIQQVLKLNNFNAQKTQLSEGFQSLIEQLRTNDPEKYNLIIANLVGVQNGFDILNDYKISIKNNMKGELMSLDFSGNQKLATDMVNEWVNKQTNGQINKLFEEPIGSDVIMIIMNAINFKAKWLNEFLPSSTRESGFYNYGTNEVQVKMMTKSMTTFNYTLNEEFNAKLIELPYIGNNLSLVIVLPEVRDGLSQLKSILTTNKLKAAIDSMKPENVNELEIPKFKTEMSYNLKKELENKLNVFSDTADFSHITETPLKVSKIIHKVIIEVGEKGTEASAVTYIEMTGSSGWFPGQHIKFIADHPFLYVLRDIRSGLILFIGQLTNL